ncbi:hypothetical protein ABMA28_011867 [Loxostege sticticalis]|uniref:Doublecortin domain-containing protein n=1 Tax=Loxostege sticticalis TaxID=481309 RepID=A0ABD0TKR1_LOXSC
MNEARVPDSETDWRNVDIFLFSNGQKQTPPRKYHLNSEDLSRWSSTLMHLARSHYGEIFSTVDLYTVDGEAVATPLQLSNGAAYVAVPPQDTFIPSGYNDYLLKAIRSREKRRNAQSEIQRDGLDTQIQEADTEAKEEVEKVETLNEMTNNATTSTIGDRVNSVQKLQPQHPARSNSTLKHTEKITHNNNSSSILKKQNSLMLPSTVRKPSMKLKENPLRKNLKVNTFKGPNSGSTIITNSSNQLKTNSRTPTRTGKNGDRHSSLRNANDRSKIENKVEPQSHNSILGTIKSSTEKTETKEISAFENVIDDNELLVVKKQESVNRSMVFTDLEKKDTAPSKRNRLSSMVPILMPIEESRISKDEPPVTAINNVIENVYKPEADIISGMTSVNKSKMELDDNIAQGTATNIQQLQEDKMKLINKHPVDSFIAVIDKGDLIDLNLKIQVRKCEGVISTQDSKPFINSIIQKASQVNIDQEIVETIEKRSSLKNKLTIDEDNTKLVVIQCSCCENRNLSEILQKIDTGTVKLNDKKYVIVLPDPPSPKTVER